MERFVRVPYALPEAALEEAVDLMARAWGVRSPVRSSPNRTRWWCS